MSTEVPLAALGGRVAVVTGAASGIGRAVAALLAACGARLALVDSDEQRLAATTTDLGRRTSELVEAVPCDLADPDAVTGLADAVGSRLGVPWILIGCAGITGPRATLADTTREEWRRVHAVNLEAAVFTAQVFVPAMVEAGDGGRIVHISSTSAHRASALSLAYASSKAGLEAVTRVLAGELAGHEIRVNAVAPGITATSIHGPDDSPAQQWGRARSGPTSNLLGRVASPGDIARTVVHLCGPGGDQITGQVLHVSAGAVV